MSPRPLAASVDVGGTFTDVVTLDLADGTIVVGKQPTVAEAPAEGIVAALESADAAPEQIERFTHGTTIGINTLLQRRGAKVGFLATRGFRDMLVLRTSSWPAFRLTWDAPSPIVPRSLSAEVDGRVRADGTVETDLDLEQVVARTRELIGRGAESIAVCFINSYAYPEHERRAGEAIREAFPGLEVVLSHELTRRYREFQRASTAVGEAYLRPTMARYFDRLEEGMVARGFDGRLLITSSDGGVMGVELARERALRTLVSGCAAGVAGAAVVARAGGWSDIIAIDMGGTSFDAALVRGGLPTMTPSAEIAGEHYLMPMLDLATIGAGGGSLASVDDVGALEVGPRSAGSTPGPVSYGRGGTEPTFTDAAVVTGLLPTTLIDGGMTLDAAAARTAIADRIAGPLGIDVDAAAAGILRVVEAKMARLLEEMTVGQGVDPRSFAIFAYGGGGPLVAARLAEELGIGTVVIPPHPGVFSAWGMQTLDVVQERSRTLIRNPEDFAPEDLVAPFGELVDEAVATLRAEGVDESHSTLLRFVEMRYEGQEHTILIPFDDGGSTALRAAFDAAHQSAFGFTVDGGTEILTYLVRAIGELPKPPFTAAQHATGTGRARTSREVRDRSAGTRSTWPVWSRIDILEGIRVEGPAIVEEPTTTTVLPPGWTAVIDDKGNLVMSR
ncbi:hydantoinase/oxoprolinase family protein [Amnibacterium flavum]|uniref:5-oxoprolinase n=1 Tax=Amnibacterium flavum TaxID=2173173 RepID=A0A2V1HS31_9MICO|nr:hydantoinase/oxoprolinase family protein [Amnibacterium flavum]PVZ95368.1 hypothetical protein DDQ50_02285 [Amnibacterium flavum]